MFHVKHPEKRISFTDTKIRKDPIENVIVYPFPQHLPDCPKPLLQFGNKAFVKEARRNHPTPFLQTQDNAGKAITMPLASKTYSANERGKRGSLEDQTLQSMEAFPRKC